MVSAFRGVLEFFDRIGIYDVVLPFLLVFSIVFAILEKSKVFGTEVLEDGKRYTKKNINSMVAFVVAFLVVASSEIVRIINESLANMVILLMLAVSFLILIGVFYKAEDEEGFWLSEGGWRTLWIIIMFVGIVLIFLNSLGWLEVLWEYLYTKWDSTVVGSVILLAIVIGMMYAITKSPKEGGK
ncbi:hypothetical protein D6774_04770 [Candidatus Woesearchaeota archaeon]|jgi:hypothetical protein|nr:MAG: hypothetical protein D6774_04770 [Candidatus Woesearchaeota archaeon]